MTFWSHLKINLFTFLASAAGLCSNAFASASANANAAFALAFDCPAANAFVVSFHIGVFCFDARQFGTFHFGDFHFDAVPVRRVSL